ncbi:MAG TPA: transposase, partial [Rhabdochlamydiaceae bacterium]
SFHPHIHCIVSGGGLAATGKWKNANKDKHGFLFPVKAMSIVYRAMLLKRLQGLIKQGKLHPVGCASNGVNLAISDEEWNTLKEKLYKKNWVVYCKRPLGGPEQVIEYLGRYTHKVAISNHRLLSVEESGVTFRYKDYGEGSKLKVMKLSIEEFLRRFAQHILPKGFTKIRMYGFLANRYRTSRLQQIQKLLKLPRPMPKIKLSAVVMLLTRYAFNPLLCPKCKQGTLKLIEVVRPRSDPNALFQIHQ